MFHLFFYLLSALGMAYAGAEELLAQLEHLEDQRADCIVPFLSKLFRDFHSHQARVFPQMPTQWMFFMNLFV